MNDQNIISPVPMSVPNSLLSQGQQIEQQYSRNVSLKKPVRNHTQNHSVVFSSKGVSAMKTGRSNKFANLLDFVNQKHPQRQEPMKDKSMK